MTSRVIEGMSVETDGEGEPVICLHGLGGTSNSFTPQMTALSGRLVVRPDLPGCGRSHLADAPSISAFAAAVARMADRLGIRSASLVGHSMGTIIGQHLAADRPSFVRKLVLIGALIEPPETARVALRQRACVVRREGLAQVATQIADTSTSAATRTHNPAAMAFVRESVLRQSPEGYARACEALAAARAARHEHIRCPVLIITGEEDATAPPSMARLLAERIAGTRVAILPRCGHWPTVERPHEVNFELRRFV